MCLLWLHTSFYLVAHCDQCGCTLHTFYKFITFALSCMHITVYHCTVLSVVKHAMYNDVGHSEFTSCGQLANSIVVALLM